MAYATALLAIAVAVVAIAFLAAPSAASSAERRELYYWDSGVVDKEEPPYNNIKSDEREADPDGVNVYAYLSNYRRLRHDEDEDPEDDWNEGLDAHHRIQAITPEALAWRPVGRKPDHNTGGKPTDEPVDDEQSHRRLF